MSIADIVDRHRIVVCVGTGGVGKTTVSASLALYAAMRGRRAMVLTIDPAHRLAQSLGLDALGSNAERIPEELVRAAGLEIPGSLSAGMLDQKSAWDEFIGRHAPNPEVRDAILRNEFYAHLSRSFAGSIEYMAIEELCRVDESGDYDLIVLDTPPTGHALDFLEAPQRLEAFLDRNLVGMLVKPYMSVGMAAWRGTSRTLQFLLQRVEEATGIQTLAEVADFFVAMDRLFDGIAERSRKVRALLRGDATAFLLVAGCEEQVMGEAEDLTVKMNALGVGLKGVVMNRVHVLPGMAKSELRLDEGLDPAHDETARVLERAAAQGVPEEVCGWMAETFAAARAVSFAESVRRESFESDLDDEVVVATIPEMNQDVHDLGSLARLAGYLTGPDS